MVADAAGRVEEMLKEIQAGPWDYQGRPLNQLEYSEALGRLVRSGDWEDQQVTTLDKIRQALDDSRFRDAAEMGDFFLDEAAIIYGIFRPWITDINEFLLGKGVPADELKDANAKILSLLDLPDGRPFRARQLWEEFRSLVREFFVLCGEQKADEARAIAEDFATRWRQIHDRDVDHIYGLLNEIAVRFGEEMLEEAFSGVVDELFKMRYSKFDIDQFEWGESLWTNLYLVFEAMRGHMVGPGREGNMEFTEDEDRFTFRFDPCGSGHHTIRGDDEIEGTPPRMEPPYNWGVTSKKLDFAGNQEGVCYYCTNCLLVMQQMPIDAYGYPVRVVEPPTWPSNTDAKCAWHVYKDPTKVPVEFYEAVGRKKPKEFGSKGGTKAETES